MSLNNIKERAGEERWWEEEYDKKFGGGGYIQPDGQIFYTHAHDRRKDFVRMVEDRALERAKETVSSYFKGLICIPFPQITKRSLLDRLSNLSDHE